MAAVRFTFILGAAFILSCGTAAAREIGQADLAAMRDAAKTYADAWLTNDADTVMATFVDEPVLSPSGLPYVEGQDAVRAFWFSPDAPPAMITEFFLTEIESRA